VETYDKKSFDAGFRLGWIDCFNKAAQIATAFSHAAKARPFVSVDADDLYMELIKLDGGWREQAGEEEPEA
jgi:hypothetical protein